MKTMAKRNAINFNARHENYKIQNFNSMDLQNEEEDYQVTRELDLDSGRDYDLLEHKSCQMLKGDDLTYTNMATHEIETTTNIPINKRQYRMPESTKRHIDEQIDEMLKLKIIKPSKSPWNAPVLCVPKKDDANGNKRYRIVVDFRALNTITKQYVFPIPLINEILDNIGDSQYFSSIDLKSGFYQIPINPKDASKTAFSTSKGHFEFNRMPMGLKNSPSTFQKLMNTILYEIQPVKAFVYLDDIVIFGKTIQEHNENLCKVLEALKRNNLKIEPEKCNILKTEIKYLGHIIDKNGIRPTDENIKTIQKMEKPKTIKGVRSFLGTVNFYGKFIPNMADKRKPLNNLLKKNVKFRWTDECDVAFNQLKECLISEPILVRPNYQDTFVITTDASDYAIGAVLSNEKTTDHPIAYASRALIGAELRYYIIEKELLAIVWAIEYFKHFVFNQKFIVYTDHRPLIAIWRLKENSSTLSKLRLKIQGLNCEIRYKQGKENVVADFLSRLEQPKVEKETNSQQYNDEEAPKQESNLIGVLTRFQKRCQNQNSIVHPPTQLSENKCDAEKPDDKEKSDDNQNQNQMQSNDDDTAFNDLMNIDINLDDSLEVEQNKDEEEIFDSEVDYNLLKFNKNKMKLNEVDATIAILNSRTAFKELQELIDLPHGFKDFLSGEVISMPKDKIWGIILNGSKQSALESRKLFNTLRNILRNNVDFSNSGTNIQIISFRKIKSSQDFDILCHIAKKFNKVFHLYSSDSDRMFVEPENRATVLKEFHDAPLGGHVGSERMLKRLRPLFIWENMKRDIQNYVRQCDSCQKNKIWPANRIPMKITTTSEEPFQKIYMDIVVLPVSEENNRYGLVIQDDLTRFLTVVPMKNQESYTVAKAFVENFICRFGTPLELVTDNGSNFVSSLMKNVCKILKIKKITTSAYHPQANLVERSNRELKIYLRQYIVSNPLIWDELLPFFSFEYNTTINSSTGYSPYELLYGRKARIPNSVYCSNNNELNYADYLEELKANFKNVHGKAKENLVASKITRKEIYDRQTNNWQPMWGELVLVKTNPIGAGKKLQELWKGPYEVVDLPSEQTTIIKNGKKLEKIHNNRLRKYND
uniref:RNA-directed DNA polymerase n=1 Tax=Aedes albopictus TaxID=7160 RepID=A0ABM1XJY4_AEDAL